MMRVEDVVKFLVKIKAQTQTTPTHPKIYIAHFREFFFYYRNVVATIANVLIIVKDIKFYK